VTIDATQVKSGDRSTPTAGAIRRRDIIGSALLEGEYLDTIRRAGFPDVEVT
jgi:hypothetical protein